MLETKSDFELLTDLLSAHREAAVMGALPLNSKSVVYVVGAYKGDTVHFLRRLFDCRVHAFEPQEWAYSLLTQRFEGDDSVVLHNYGLGTDTGLFPMGEYGNDACSFVLPPERSRTVGQGLMRDVSMIMDALETQYVDLMIMNIEGYEYKLLEYMRRKMLLPLVRNLLVQFHMHDTMPYGDTINMLCKTHRNVWDGANWMLWRLE